MLVYISFTSLLQHYQYFFLWRKYRLPKVPLKTYLSVYNFTSSSLSEGKLVLELASLLYCLVNDPSSEPCLDPFFEPLDLKEDLSEPSLSLDFFLRDFFGMLGRPCELDDSPRGLPLLLSFCFWRLLEDLVLWFGLPIGESAEPMLLLSHDALRLDDFGKPGTSRPGDSFTTLLFVEDESTNNKPSKQMAK